MKIKSSFLLAILLGASPVAFAYNHRWTGNASGEWNLGQNWTNNVPNPGENRAMRLFFVDDGSPLGTVQDIPGLVVDYLDVRGPFQFEGGFGRKLSFQDTNGASSQSVTLYLNGGCTFADNLEIGLRMPVAITAPYTGIPNAVAAYLNGPITGPGELRYYGGGRLEFGGDRANTFAGPLTVFSGTLRLNKDGAAAIPHALILGNGTSGDIGAAALCMRPNQFAPGATVTINSDARLDFDDQSQTLGGLTLNGGRVLTGSGLLSLGGSVNANPADVPSSIEGQVFLGFVSHTFAVGGKYTNEGLRVMAKISGASGAALIKDGPGTLNLAGTNVYHGATIINEGTLLANGPSPLGSTNGGTTVHPGATLHLEQSDLGDEPLTLSGQGVGDLGALFVFGSSDSAGPVALPADAGITVWPGHTLRLNGVVAGPGGLTLASGTVALGGNSANTYSGATRVLSTTLELRKRTGILNGSIGLPAVPGPLFIGPGFATVRLVYDNGIGNASAVSLSGNGKLDVNGQADTIGSLDGAGTVALGDGELTVGGNPNSTTSAAVISGMGGRLRKIGPGTFTLNAANSYTGNTAIEEGVLAINGTQPGSAITLKTNATLTGSGSVGTITSLGGIVSPGNGVGRMNSKGVALHNASIFRAQLAGPVPVTSYDQLNVSGSVQLAGCTLDATLGFAGAPSQQYVLIANDGADAVIGTFAGAPEGATLHFSGATFQISYHGGDGNDVVLTQLTASAQDFAPVLRIEPFASGQVRLFWTTNAVGFQAETTTSIPANTWHPVLGAPTVVADTYFLPVPALSNAAFFRLVKP